MRATATLGKFLVRSPTEIQIQSSKAGVKRLRWEKNSCSSLFPRTRQDNHDQGTIMMRSTRQSQAPWRPDTSLPRDRADCVPPTVHGGVRMAQGGAD
eukprot:XP_001705351.1 Hypothetical protein GL50803_4520 [Giardia lamblia ATCC 50803]